MGAAQRQFVEQSVEAANLRRGVKAWLQPDRAQEYSKLLQTIQ
jgi:hypothetical protein